jgi:hypothetical protein
MYFVKKGRGGLRTSCAPAKEGRGYEMEIKIEEALYPSHNSPS